MSRSCDRADWNNYYGIDMYVAMFVSVLRPSGLKYSASYNRRKYFCLGLATERIEIHGSRIGKWFCESRSCDRVDWNFRAMLMGSINRRLGLATEWIEIVPWLPSYRGYMSRSCDRADRISINIMLDFPCFTRSNKDTHIAVLTIYPCLCYTPTHLTVYSIKRYNIY